MLSTILTAMLSVVASVQADSPLLSRVYTVYFAPPEMVQANVCKIYSDRVEISTRQGTENSVIVVTHPINISGDIHSVISDASQGPIINTLGPSDHPVDSYTAYDKKTASEIDLGTKQSDVFTENKAATAQRLRNLIDSLCPTNW